MRRRSATGMAVAFALSCLAAAMAISAEMADGRRLERRAYALALAEREAAAAAVVSQPTGTAVAARRNPGQRNAPSRRNGGPQEAPADRSRTLCLHGAETVVARVARFLDSRLIDDNGRLDVAALARTSRRAAELDRSSVLPQRMGRRLIASTVDGGKPAWEPIEPPERACVELAELARPAGVHGNLRTSAAK